MDEQPSYSLLDGSVATNICFGETNEHNITAFIQENPHLLKKLQAEFIDAGSDIIYAPTFDANRQRLRKYKQEHNVALINKNIVAITRSVSKSRKVAGTIAPTGLSCIPYGETDFLELLNIFKEQAIALNDAGVDLFAIESMTSLSEARAAVFACLEFNKPIFVTFCIDERGKTTFGTSPLCCYVALQDLNISAFGLTCCNSPLTLLPYIKELSAFSKKPIIARPDAVEQNLSPSIMADEMAELLQAGATIIGGCRGTTPAHIRAMRELLDTYKKPTIICKEMQSNDIILANETHTFSLDNDRIDFSEPVTCEHDMTDSFIEIEDDSIDVIVVQINTVDDATQFALNAHLTTLPICFHSTNEVALETALLLYHGKAMVDLKSPLDVETIILLTEKYGAVAY